MDRGTKPALGKDEVVLVRQEEENCFMWSKGGLIEEKKHLF